VKNDFFEWRGHRIHAKATGSGEPLLLLNGLGGHTDMWAPISERFRMRTIIIFDAPGTGRSSISPYPVTIPALADLAAAVLDDFGFESADVVGYSYGGAVAQQMAYDKPDRVRRLVLAATTCGVGSVPASPRAMNTIATPFRYYSETYFERTAKAAYGGRIGRDAKVRQSIMAARQRHPPSPYGYAMQIMGGAGWSSLGFLAQIPHETLVICGDDDPLVPLENAEMLASMIPRGKLDVVKDAGHLMLWDDAQLVGARIREFIRGSRAHDVPRVQRYEGAEALWAGLDGVASNGASSNGAHLHANGADGRIDAARPPRHNGGGIPAGSRH
jgi:pimeloyl-ACP methyl ester carboxylesterase